MPRHDAERYELTDAEKRDLIKLINEGRPVPEKYQFILFEDKREVELVWNGKSREVSTAILPFQTLEHIDEPRKEKQHDEELGLDTGGRQLKGWTNKLIWGDNKLILSPLKAGALRRQIEDAGGLKLIYIDPPFDVGADFSMDIEIGGETFHKEPNLLEQIAYRDTWGRGADSFVKPAQRLLRAAQGDEAKTDHKWPTQNRATLYFTTKAVLFGLSSVALRECWHVVLGAQWMLLTQREIRRAKKRSDDQGR